VKCKNIHSKCDISQVSFTDTASEIESIVEQSEHNSFITSRSRNKVWYNIKIKYNLPEVGQMK